MKKIIALLLVLAMATSIVACGGEKEEVSKTPQTDTTVTETVTNEDETKEPAKVEEQKPAEKEDKKENKKEDKKEDKKENKKEEVKEEKPAEKPAETPAEKPAEKPAETPAEKPATPKTAGNILLADFKAKAGSYSDALSLAEALSQNSIIPFMAGAMPVEEGYLAGFDEEIHGFKEGAAFMPMIGSIPFVGYVFILEDGADVSAFISNLKSNANLRWNICVEAEEMVAGSSGNKVFFVMTNKSFEE